MHRILLITFAFLASACDGAGATCGNRGDVNGDGRISPIDAGIASEIARGDYAPDPCEKRAADYDRDGTVTEKDAEAILADFLSK